MFKIVFQSDKYQVLKVAKTGKQGVFVERQGSNVWLWKDREVGCVCGKMCHKTTLERTGRRKRQRVMVVYVDLMRNSIFMRSEVSGDQKKLCRKTQP